MAKDTVQITQYAQKLWEHRSQNFVERVEKECGYSQHELDPPDAGPWGLEWDQLPDKAKDHLRAMATKEAEAMAVPRTEIEQYLIDMLRELDRRRPAAEWSAASHGILWDQTWERLLLVVNVGDAVAIHPLVPGTLTNDPVATAESLSAKAINSINDPDADIIRFKR